MNYVHFAYRKDSMTDSGKDTFKVNYIRYYEDASLNKVSTYIISNTSTTKPNSPQIVLNQDVDTVELLRNITMTSPLEVEETRDVILDLKGYKLTINKDGSLTIIDSDYDAQKDYAITKYYNELDEFNSEYTTRTQVKEDYYTEKQAEYDAEYNTQMEPYTEKAEQYTQTYNTFVSNYKDYMNSSEYDKKKTVLFDYTGEEKVFTAPQTGTYKDW